MPQGIEAYSESLADFYGAPEPTTLEEVVGILTSDPTLSAFFLGAVGAAAAIPLLVVDQVVCAGVGHLVPRALIGTAMCGLALFLGTALALLPQVTVAQGVAAAWTTMAAYGTAVGLDAKVPRMPTLSRKRGP